MWNVKEHGAIGDGMTLDTAAIQAAIDACFQSGGGEVVFPPGRYLSSTITLRSNVHLNLGKGAELIASPNRSDYPEISVGIYDYSLCLIYADKADDISVGGHGICTGNGTEDFGSWWGLHDRPDFRIGLLYAQDCRNINISDTTFRYSDFWTLHFRFCENIIIDKVKIYNNFYRLNTDGIDPNSCKNVIISNCHIIAGDDCIVAKASEGRVMENMVVTNCILETPNTALKIGTESEGSFRDIRVSNCVIKNTSVGIGMYMKDGYSAERISFDNISVECADREHIKPVIPLYMDIEKRHPHSPIALVRDVSFTNIQIYGGSGCLFQGMPDHPIENLLLHNISYRVGIETDFSIRKKAVGGSRTSKDDGRDFTFIQKPAYASFAHIKDLFISDFKLFVSEDISKKYPRHAIYGYNVHGGNLSNILLKPRSCGTEPVQMEECSDITKT